jgi:dihydropteroate synthase
MQNIISERTFVLNCKGKGLMLKKPIVMGIINATPDSFFANSRSLKINEAVLLAEKMIGEGATIIDIGGQTTKPGSDAITAAKEIDRVVPVIEAIAKTFPETFISVDTYYAAVAEAAVNAGACIVNDISGGMFDENMITTVAKLNVPYILMYIKGVPKTMQDNPSYKNVTTDIIDYFIERINVCRQAGIKDVIIDPGFGFGKTLEHNYQLLQSLNAFQMFENPLLVGVSRKGMIYKPLNISADEALNGTTVLNTISLQQGAQILRVHDVKEAKQAIDLLQLMK